MLDKDEELRVASCIDVAKAAVNPRSNFDEGLNPKGQLWLSEKCKELNDELKKAHELLNYAMHLRMYGEKAPGGNETWKEFDRVNEHFLRGIKCQCIGLVHSNECPEWVLPV